MKPYDILRVKNVLTKSTYYVTLHLQASLLTEVYDRDVGRSELQVYF